MPNHSTSADFWLMACFLPAAIVARLGGLVTGVLLVLALFGEAPWGRVWVSLAVTVGPMTLLMLWFFASALVGELVTRLWTRRQSRLEQPAPPSVQALPPCTPDPYGEFD